MNCCNLNFFTAKTFYIIIISLKREKIVIVLMAGRWSWRF